MSNFELLSPVGDFECLKAAVQNGADAVYLGASSFSARAKAKNFNNLELYDAICYAKLRNVKVNLALNTLIKNNELQDAIELAVNAYNLGANSIIVQDLGIASYLLEKYPEIPIHASTQMTVHNLYGVKYLEKLGFKRVVLSRELSIKDIAYIRENTNIELEVFIHGALCISYSGGCLLSSMIGGRSGNRGLCAQPCRLPYELIEQNNKSTRLLDKGFLLSPRDNLGIEFLPELIKTGINSFKIEGRMKTPTYVGVVTRIYRKYINLILENISLSNDELVKLINKNLNKINENTCLSDKEELTQVFNRGGFSTGHLKPSPNKNLIFKDKPNNMGIYVGTISHINENKGHLKLKLENSLSIGDRISINNEIYTVSELMLDNKNFETLETGAIVKIGRMKGKIRVSDKLYKIESTKLNNSIFPTFKGDKNFKKIYLNGEIIIKSNTPISLRVWSDDGFYNGLAFKATSPLSPNEALNKPISKKKVIEQISKTGNTEFEFKNLNVILENNLFVQISTLNDLRRIALQGLQNLVLKENSHNLKNNFYNKKIDTINYFDSKINQDCTIDGINNKITLNENINAKSCYHNDKLIINKSISLLLNIINLNYDYTCLNNIDKLYIPLNYFSNKKYKDILNKLSNKFNIYVYMPLILSDERKVNFDKIVSIFKIKGFVISHISQLELLKKYNLEILGNYTLNIYNNYSANRLATFGITQITVSPELNKEETNEILINSNVKTELIVYGNLPVMTNQYCYLGKSNKCYSECNRKCLNNSLFYLKDRKNFNFRILPDNTSTITTMYNSKTLSIKYNDFYCNSIRIDLLDEDINQIQNIIDVVSLGERFEGKNYTNGNY